MNIYRTSDIFEKGLLEIRMLGWHIRVFTKPLSWPYGYFKYGLYAFGAGPLGFMVWTPKRGVNV